MSPIVRFAQHMLIKHLIWQSRVRLSHTTLPRSLEEKRVRLWFNPPFNSNVLTNVGRKFLRIIDECFPPHHCLHKILNRNTLKLSYSTMPNVFGIIASHNKHLLTIHAKPPNNSPTTRTCNCRIKESCPLNGAQMPTRKYCIPGSCRKAW